MPKIPQELLAKREALKASIATKRKKYLEYKRNFEDPVYAEGMSVLAERNATEIPDLSKADIYWDEDVVKSLGEEDD